MVRNQPLCGIRAKERSPAALDNLAGLHSRPAGAATEQKKRSTGFTDHFRNAPDIVVAHDRHLRHRISEGMGDALPARTSMGDLDLLGQRPHGRELGEGPVEKRVHGICVLRCCGPVAHGVGGALLVLHFVQPTSRRVIVRVEA